MQIFCLKKAGPYKGNNFLNVPFRKHFTGSFVLVKASGIKLFCLYFNMTNLQVSKSGVGRGRELGERQGVSIFLLSVDPN